jgi:hypothetical protein
MRRGVGVWVRGKLLANGSFAEFGLSEAEGLRMT